MPDATPERALPAMLRSSYTASTTGKSTTPRWSMATSLHVRSQPSRGRPRSQWHKRSRLRELL